MNKYLIALTVAVVLLAGAVGYVFYGQSNGLLGAAGSGPNHYQSENFLQGLFAGTKGQLKISNTGALTLTNSTAVNVIGGTLVANNFIQGSAGWSQTISATTTLTAPQFCSAASVLVKNTTGSITITLPAATTTYVTCGSSLFGTWSTQLIANESSNTVSFVGGTGTTIRTASGTTASLGASSTMLVSGYWLTSSTLIIADGVPMH